MEKITIIIADDHSVVRKGTRQMLEIDENIQILAEASNAQEAINLTKEKKPNILLLDISMPDKNGIEVLKNIKADDPTQKIIIFTAHAETQYIKAAISANVDGFLSKSIDSNELNESIKRIIKGERVFSQDISSHLANLLWDDINKPSALTKREYDIMIFLARGKSNQEIATELCIAVRTVETHVANILKKLKLSNRTQISSYAYENGLI